MTKFSPVGKNSPLTPEQIAAYNVARVQECRERKRNALPEHLRPKRRNRYPELPAKEQLNRLYKAINRPALTYTVPPGEHYFPHPKDDGHSAEYWRLYNLARYDPNPLGKPRSEYIVPTNPKRKPRRRDIRLGHPAVETKWSGTTTLRPHIARQIKQAHGLISRKPPAIPRGTLTQTQLLRAAPR